MVVDTGVTDVKQTVEELDGQAAEPPPADSPVETETARVAPTEQRAWSMPKSPVTRKQADAWGRIALKAGAGIARFAAGVARYGARVVEQLWLAIGKVPAALRLLFVVGILMLLGVVGSMRIAQFRSPRCAPLSWSRCVRSPSARWDTAGPADSMTNGRDGRMCRPRRLPPRNMTERLSMSTRSSRWRSTPSVPSGTSRR